ncbi:ABC transporter substrate-binding protein [Paenibacillus sp. BC26]|uniref:ABC transporter substrate-binding protein n=1 Tax=Paenibacillus sp. BC26 TaxID=1881032 RepID=UPI0008E3B19F|nr:extracellular solute-binding protein [Paenibacillus sp. BC26]SFT06255.1 multiple sugar transport system substrate-binding protein [Paenibacillus sp. BC26]
MKEPLNSWEEKLAGKPPVKNGFTSELEHKVRERILMQNEKRRSPYRAVAALMSIVLLLGCGWWFRDDVKQLLKPNSAENIPAALRGDPLSDGEYTINIHQFAQDGSIEYQIKRPFIIRHPSVKLNMIDAPRDLYNDPDLFKAWMDKEQPDMLQLPLKLFKELAADGKLKSLDTIVKEHKFELGTLYPPIIELLRQLGGSGELYGLPADFSTMALYINEDAFAKQGIPLPEGEMSPEEIMQLAKRFQGTGVSGLDALNITNKFALTQFFGQVSGLQTFSKDNEGKTEATVNSDAWKQVWQSVAAGYREGWITQQKPLDVGKNGIMMKDMGKNDAFAQGKIAMKIAPSYYYSNLENFKFEGVMKVNWATVSLRVDASATNQLSFLGTNTVYAINAASTQDNAVWELISFIISGTWRSGLENPQLYTTLLADQSVMDEKDSKHWKAFYENKVDPAKAAEGYRMAFDNRAKVELDAALSTLGGEQMEAIVKGSKSVDAALEELQSTLEARLAGKGDQSHE